MCIQNTHKDRTRSAVTFDGLGRKKKHTELTWSYMNFPPVYCHQVRCGGKKNDAVPGSNEQVLAAHLPEVDRWLEPHRGRWLVRRAFPQATCSTQAPFGTQGWQGGNVEVGDSGNSDEFWWLLRVCIYIYKIYIHNIQTKLCWGFKKSSSKWI